MDIERAVGDFVSNGKDLFHGLRSEGQSLSDLALGMLRPQLHILTVEAARLNHARRSSNRDNANPESSENSSVQVAVRRKNKKKSESALPNCSHTRLIDDVVDVNEKRIRLVYCLECGAIIKDPFPKPK